MPQVGGHLLAAGGSIVMVVSVGHRGGFGFGFEGSGGRRSSVRDLGKVYVLTGGPWRGREEARQSKRRAREPRQHKLGLLRVVRAPSRGNLDQLTLVAIQNAHVHCKI